MAELYPVMAPPASVIRFQMSGRSFLRLDKWLHEQQGFIFISGKKERAGRRMEGSKAQKQKKNERQCKSGM